MTEAVRIRRNSVFSLFSISVRLLANVIVFWIIGSYYGPKIFGQFTAAHTLATIFILFADFGLDILLTTEIARNKKNAVELFQKFFSIKIVFAFFALIAMWVVSLSLDFSSDVRLLILIFSFYVPLTTLTNFLFALYKGFEKLEYETGVSLIVNVTLLVIVIVLLIVHVNVIYIAYSFVITRLIGFLVAFTFSFNLLPTIKYKITFVRWKELKDKVIIFGLTLLFGTLFFQLDTILLSIWKGDKDVGIYQAAFKLIALPLVIPDILINALLPVLTRLNEDNEQKWIKLEVLLNKTLTFISIPLSIILFIFSDYIINFIYPINEYSDAIPILRIFAIILFFRFAVESFALMLTTSNRQKIRMIIVFLGTVLNLGLNYFVIPKYGPFGAAVISLITNILIGIGYIIPNFRYFQKWIFNVQYITTIIISFLFSLILWQIRSFYPLLQILVIISFTLPIIIKYSYTKEEKKLILFDGLSVKSIFKNIKTNKKYK